MYWLGAILAISLLIIVHEAGHYLVAKWCKMRVDRFSLGFGPALLGWRRNGTLFQLAPIPFGGFVEIRGMNIAEEVDPDDPYAYPNRPVWQRVLTIFAGPATNYLFAMFLAIIVFSVAGVQSNKAWYNVTGVDEGFDAYGKLEVGDRVVAIQRPGDAAPISLQFQADGEPAPISDLVHQNGDKPLTLFVVRAGQESKEIAVQLQAKQDPTLTYRDTKEKQYRLGIQLNSYEVERVQVGIMGAVGHALYYPVAQTQRILTDLYDIITGRQKGEFAGPVGITHVIQRAIEIGWISALQLVMMISVYLGLFNLLPLPALDGGRLAFLIYEMATRRRANPKIEATVHMVGIMCLLVLMVMVTVKDCSRLFG